MEVDAKEKFASSFMTDFINGKLRAVTADEKLFSEHLPIGVYDNSKREFSAEAKAVFDAGRKLWRYYHSQPEVNVNASLYDIREYFQGRNDKGRMNARSTDEKYTELIGNLRRALNILAQKITPKIYEYEFLR